MTSIEYLGKFVGWSRSPFVPTKILNLKASNDKSFPMHKALAALSLVVFTFSAYLVSGSSWLFIFSLGADNHFSWQALTLDFCLLTLAYGVFAPKAFMPSMGALIGAMGMVVLGEITGLSALIVAAVPFAIAHLFIGRYIFQLVIGFFTFILVGPSKTRH